MSKTLSTWIVVTITVKLLTMYITCYKTKTNGKYSHVLHDNILIKDSGPKRL
jgi:hypothetical protein